MNAPLLDSGKRQKFDTGSQRDSSEGKGRYDLLPLEGIHELAKLFEKGANKYSARNWEAGQPMSQYFNSGLRHAFKWLGGWRDEDHLVAATWNFLCAVTTRERIADGRLPKELDDLPTPSEAPSLAERIPTPRIPRNVGYWSDTLASGQKIYGLQNAVTGFCGYLEGYARVLVYWDDDGKNKSCPSLDLVPLQCTPSQDA